MKKRAFRLWETFLCALLVFTAFLAVPQPVGAVSYPDSSILEISGDTYWDGTKGIISVTGDKSNAKISTLVFNAKKNGVLKIYYSYYLLSPDGTKNSTELSVFGNTVEKVTTSKSGTTLVLYTTQAAGTEENPKNAYANVEMTAGASVNIAVTVGKNGGRKTSGKAVVTITNVEFIEQKDVTATFAAAENGSYTVNGTAITRSWENTQSSTTTYSVAATPASGRTFVDWYWEDGNGNGKSISTKQTDTALTVGESGTVCPRFAATGTPIFGVGDQRFTDLDAANTCAVGGTYGNTIVLLNNATLTGTHKISSGVTLLIPRSDNDTVETSAEKVVVYNESAAKEYRRLTMAAGASINVEGSLLVNGRYHAPSGGQTGRNSGEYGCIMMGENSTITVKNGAKLYAFGFISGEGSVVTEGNAEVVEFFQIADFGGGTATNAVAVLNFGKKIFPITQYYVQNIEASLTICYGATETIYTGITDSSSSIYVSSASFIGSDDKCLFELKKDSSVTKRYDGATDRINFSTNGNVVLGGITVNVGNWTSVNSASYVLPITSNMTVNIESGTLSVSEKTELLPGVQVNVHEGATLSVDADLYLYDREAWVNGGFVWRNTCLKGVGYAPSKEHTRTSADLVDAELNVNGTVLVDANLYTTKGDGDTYGANITSSEGTGKIVFNSKPTAESKTYQFVAKDGSNGTDYSFPEIPSTAAKLRNADGSYTTTSGASAGDVYYYCLTKCGGVWHKLAEYPVAQSTSTTLYDESGTATLADETAQTFETLTEAINSTTDGTFIRLLHDVPPEKVQMTDDVHLDLNGCNAHVDFTGNGTVYAIDSATDYELDDDHTVTYSAKTAGKITGTTMQDKFAKTVTVTGDGVTTSFKRYVMVQDGAAYSFHRFNISITGFEALFDPTAKSAVFRYSAVARGDETVTGAITKYGFDFGDGKEYTNAVTMNDEVTSEVGWGGILTKENADTKYGAQAYLTFKNGGTQASMKVQMSLLDGLAYAYNNGGLSMPNAVGETTEEEIKDKLDAVMEDMGLGDAWSKAKSNENWKSAKTA